ncbi:hypothetical protein Ancab_021754 [Ancistrocladus abbreviatus]
MSLMPKSDSIQIREVWDHSLEEEFALIREVVDAYRYIAMVTEFEGVVLRPIRNCNLPTCGTDKYCIWQFNFREFNVNEDAFANDSIELLRQIGINFKKNNEKGIDA